MAKTAKTAAEAFATETEEAASSSRAALDGGGRIDIANDARVIVDPLRHRQSSSSHTTANDATAGYDDTGFLLSMTFALGGRGIGCDCSDCDENDDPLPKTVREAVNAHNDRKRQRIESSSSSSFTKTWGSINSTITRAIRQNRSLVRREGPYSLWRLDVPLESYPHGTCGDPIVEQRNGHRILHVMRLDGESSTVLSIGNGIIGSAMEGGTRKRMDWIEGSSYLLPRSEGIACGWIHVPRDGWKERDDDDDNNNNNAIGDNNEGRDSAADDDYHDGGPRTVDDVVLYSLKVSVEALRGTEDDDETFIEDSASRAGLASDWIGKSRELFLGILGRRRRLLLPRKSRDDDGRGDDDDVTANNTDEDGMIVPPEGIVLSNDEALMMRSIIDLALP